MSTKMSRRHLGAVSAAGAFGLLITACGGSPTTSGSGGGSGDVAADGESAEGDTVEIEDNYGTQTVAVPAERIVITDNRLFRPADAWGVEAVAVPKPLVPAGVSYGEDESVLDVGSHREPNLEAFVEAQPDLVLNGQRFATQREDIIPLIGDAAIVDLTPRDGEPFDEELRRQITGVGTVLGKESEAEDLIAAFDESIEAAGSAYDGSSTVMGVLTTGGDISYVAPSTGRAIGPVFDMLGLNPALDSAAEDTSHGDDISVEAIAQSAPEWLLVLDRDAAVADSGEEHTPAQDLIEGSEALAGVPAVQKGQVVYMPADFYTTEDILAYTEFLTAVAEAFAAS